MNVQLCLKIQARLSGFTRIDSPMNATPRGVHVETHLLIQENFVNDLCTSRKNKSHLQVFHIHEMMPHTQATHLMHHSHNNIVLKMKETHLFCQDENHISGTYNCFGKSKAFINFIYLFLSSLLFLTGPNSQCIINDLHS